MGINKTTPKIRIGSKILRRVDFGYEREELVTKIYDYHGESGFESLILTGMWGYLENWSGDMYEGVGSLNHIIKVLDY